MGMWFWQTILSENFSTIPFPFFCPASYSLSFRYIKKTSFTQTQHLQNIWFSTISINCLNDSPWIKLINYEIIIITIIVAQSILFYVLGQQRREEIQVKPFLYISKLFFCLLIVKLLYNFLCLSATQSVTILEKCDFLLKF